MSKQLDSIEETNKASTSDIETEEYNDSLTKEKFGEKVIVTTTFGLPESDEEVADTKEDGSESADGDAPASQTKGSTKPASKEKELTLFQRIQVGSGVQ